jgi:hypothetical protein
LGISRALCTKNLQVDLKKDTGELYESSLMTVDKYETNAGVLCTEDPKNKILDSWNLLRIFF